MGKPGMRRADIPLDDESTLNAPEQENEVGSILRERREQRGLSREEVAAALHLSRQIVDDLERDRFEALPPAIFVRGYLKSYAALLEIDADPLVRAFNARRGVQTAQPLRVNKPVQTAPDMSAGMKRLLPWALGISLIVVAGVWGVDVYRSMGAVEDTPQSGDADLNGASAGVSGDTPESGGAPDTTAGSGTDDPIAEVVEPEPETRFTNELAGPPEGIADGGAADDGQGDGVTGAQAPEAVAEQTTAARSESTGDNDAAGGVPGANADDPDVLSPDVSGADDDGAPLVLSFSGPSWVEVYDAEGERLLYGLIEETGQHTLSGPTPYSVVIGDTQYVSVEHRGEPVDLGVRRPGRVARLQVPR